MNGGGVGTAVALGTITGLGVVVGSAQVIEYVTTFAFYRLLSGFTFHEY